MHTTILATFFEISRTVVSMCGAGILLFVIALWAAKTDIARARGLDKIVALSNLCFAIPLAVFGALHLSGARFIMLGVPSYMPWRLFWAYFVGFALLAASLSIATKIQVRWSGLLFGIMMFLFVAMMDIPGALATPRDRIAWTLVVREMTFGGGGWILAGNAMRGQGGEQAHNRGPRVDRDRRHILWRRAFSAPSGMPRSPAGKTDACVDSGAPAHWLSDGRNSSRCRGMHSAGQEDADGGNLSRHLDCAAGLVHLWADPDRCSCSDPSTAVKIEGINYFADTLLFAGAILALASATPRTD